MQDEIKVGANSTAGKAINFHWIWPFVGKLSLPYLREFYCIWDVLSIGLDNVETLQVKHGLSFDMGPKILVSFMWIVMMRQ